MKTSAKLYLLCASFIIAWWLLAFYPQFIPSPSEVPASPAEQLPSSPTSTTSPLVDRNTLKNALSGDIALMTQLIATWDIDAQLMHHAKRIPKDRLLRSQWIGRQLSHLNQGQLITTQAPYCKKTLVDASGKALTVDTSRRKRFLPQTYAAASFLLALVSPEEIIALPRSMREQVDLYPRALTDQIPLDIDRYNSEELFQAHPDIAFVATYSHPATIQTLENQGIALYMLKSPFSFDDIIFELQQIGHITNRPLQAELLSIFIEAALINLDNHLMAFIRHTIHQHRPLPRVLLLNYHQHFSIFSLKTLAGQLMARLGALDVSSKYVNPRYFDEWMTPITKEGLTHLAPDCLIIVTEHPEMLRKTIYADPALTQLPALRKKQLHFMDEAAQSSASQHVVIAYYDLIYGVLQQP